MLNDTNDFLQASEIHTRPDLNRFQQAAAGTHRRDDAHGQPFRINAIQAGAEEGIACFQIIVVVDVIQIQFTPPRPSHYALPSCGLE